MIGVRRVRAASISTVGCRIDGRRTVVWRMNCRVVAVAAVVAIVTVVAVYRMERRNIVVHRVDRRDGSFCSPLKEIMDLEVGHFEAVLLIDGPGRELFSTARLARGRSGTVLAERP